MRVSLADVETQSHFRATMTPCSAHLDVWIGTSVLGEIIFYFKLKKRLAELGSIY